MNRLSLGVVGVYKQKGEFSSLYSQNSLANLFPIWYLAAALHYQIKLKSLVVYEIMTYHSAIC